MASVRGSRTTRVRRMMRLLSERPEITPIFLAGLFRREAMARDPPPRHLSRVRPRLHRAHGAPRIIRPHTWMELFVRHREARRGGTTRTATTRRCTAPTTRSRRHRESRGSGPAGGSQSTRASRRYPDSRRGSGWHSWPARGTPSAIGGADGRAASSAGSRDGRSLCSAPDSGSTADPPVRASIRPNDQPEAPRWLRSSSTPPSAMRSAVPGSSTATSSCSRREGPSRRSARSHASSRPRPSATSTHARHRTTCRSRSSTSSSPSSSRTSSTTRSRRSSCAPSSTRWAATWSAPISTSPACGPRPTATT